MTQNQNLKLLNHLQIENEQLKKEIAHLKRLLSNIMHSRDESKEIPKDVKIISHRALPQEKIHLIKGLFKGRTDVFAKRWESRDGKKGYVPACELEWQKPICQKPKISCSACQHRKLKPLTDQVLYDHLSGEITVGIYPLLQDDNCHFLVFDFDKQSYQQDVLALIKECKQIDLPVYIERSRSGNGAHVWLFFSENISAALARKLGMHLLTKTHESRYQIGFDSFDRMLPSQDTLPKGGFGNLVCLPLQLHSKNAGNSVFVDESFTPFEDQWLYLSTIEKVSKKDILKAIKRLNIQQVTRPIASEEIPKKIKVILKNGLYIQKEGIPSVIFSKMMSLASFSNPEFYKKQSKRMSTHGLQRVIGGFDENAEFLILPRGCIEDLAKLFKEYSIQMELENETYDGEDIQVNFTGDLTSQQEDAIQNLINFNNGTLAATTGFGKTVTAAALIATRKTNTLIIVDRTQLIQQWVGSLTSFLDIPSQEIGQVGGGKKNITGKIDVATIQSLNSKGELKSFITQYGQIIVDECHHISAFTFEKVMKRIRAKYVYGLTATPIRKDGLHPIIFMQCGPIRYKTDAKKQAKIRPFKHTLIPRYTDFRTNSTDLQEIYHSISINEHRNQLLFDDVLKELDKGRSPIILTERIEHLEYLKGKFNRFAKNIIVLTGKMNKKEREKEMERLAKIPDTEERLIIATGKFVGEGFDDPRLDTLFLAMPISWKGTLQQYVGRLHRIHSNKLEVKVFDYVDGHVPILKTMFEKRMNGYKTLGYTSVKEEKDSTEQMQLF